jgi:hypothetical protein
MSRARSINYNGSTHWFDTEKNSRPAKVEHLEVLATVEDLEADDLLDEGLNQGQVIERLRKSLGQGVIPAHILEKHRKRREAAQQERICRICSTEGRECEGKITRHHFVTRWLMKELENYESYARRDRCTIPVCMGAHRDLHMRNDGDKSIIRYLTDEERHFAHKMLSELEEQHPKIISLARAGDPEVSYEARLIRDYDEGKFAAEALTISEESVYLKKSMANAMA